MIHAELAQATTGQLREFEYALDLPDGPHRFNARLARLPETDQYMLVARDITERETLRQQGERLQQFINQRFGSSTPFQQQQQGPPRGMR